MFYIFHCSTSLFLLLRLINFVSTFNEPAVFTIHGLADGYMAPGISNFDHFISSVHNVNLAHGLSMQSMRSLRSDLELGCVLNLGPCIPCTNKKDDILTLNNQVKSDKSEILVLDNMID